MKKIGFLKTLRGRLALWYLVSTLFVFVILSTTLAGLLWVTLHTQIDHHLQTVVNEAKQIVESNQGGQREEMLKNLVSTQGMTVVLLSPDGTPLLQTNSPDIIAISEHQIQQVINSRDGTSDEPIGFTAENIRFSVVSVDESGGRGTLAVGYSVGIIDHSFQEIMLVTISVVIVLLLPLSLVGYKLLKKNLKPLETIADVANKVTSAKSLSLRVSTKNTTSEIETISLAFNQMLDKLQTTFEKEHQFFSDTAHTLKTPLAVLRSQIDNLNSLSVSRKKVLFENVDDLAEVIDKLLLISRIETKGKVKKKTFSLTNVMNEIAELTRLLGSDKKLTVQEKISKNVSIKADKRLIRRAIGNVIQNAVAYSKKNKKIYIGLRKSKTGRVEIIIKDTGHGISEDDLPHVLDRFYRGKSNIATKGSGLGLAITKAIIESMGGEIVIESKLGKRTEVKIILPP